MLTKKEVINLIDKFLPSIYSVYPNAEVYLFGSYAKGCATEESDIDVGIIIPEFDPTPEINWGKRGQLEDMAFDIDYRLSPTVLTPNNRSGFFDSVTKLGERIA